MKKFLYTLITLLVTTVFVSCSQEETYAEQKEHENNCINAFLAGNSQLSKQFFKNGIEVITEQQFVDQGYVTKNPADGKAQFILFETTGVYMHIVSLGNGDKLESGKSTNVLCRFAEYNINSDQISMTNKHLMDDAKKPDIIALTNNSGTFTASFLSGVMPTTNSNTEVPNGWLVPFKYIKLGRYLSSDEIPAHVYLIVPHSQGHSKSMTNVYACFYDIEYIATENQ